MTHKLAAIKVERRSVATAVFVGDRLDYVQRRQLSSAPSKAEASAVGFVNWTVNTFEIHSVALEAVTNGDVRRVQLTESILKMLRENGVPIWKLSKQDMFAAYGIPPLRTRRELWKVILSIWPILDRGEQGNDGILDAAALGLLVATERLLLTET
ncbi:MAG TPA: hypothetical protein VGK99_15355 [Acidobacteriota bacterium]|jgi:hypothetical protein